MACAQQRTPLVDPDRSGGDDAPAGDLNQSVALVYGSRPMYRARLIACESMR